MSNKAAVIHEKGTPDVFRWQDWPVGEPGPGEVLIRHGAIGVNYIDTYNRRGMPHPWPVPPLPFVVGIEGAGTVEAVGDGVTECAVGDRVTYASPPHGAYAQRRVMPAERMVRLPDGISEEDAAGITLKGLTAQYLLRRTYRVQPGDAVLVHAAAGGMGLILCQWAKHLGATVIGTVSTDEKAELAKAHGADHVAVYSREDFVPLVMEVTEGKGCPVVYESIGKDTFTRSLDCLRPLGILASYGHASGAPDPVDVVDLGHAARCSSPVRRSCTMSRNARTFASAQELFDVVSTGAVTITVRTAIRCARPLTCTAPSRNGAPPARRCFCPSAKGVVRRRCPVRGRSTITVRSRYPLAMRMNRGRRTASSTGSSNSCNENRSCVLERWRTIVKVHPDGTAHHRLDGASAVRLTRISRPVRAPVAPTDA